VNLWLPSAARILSRTESCPQKVAHILAEKVRGCGRKVSSSEINRAVQLIFDTPVDSNAEYVAYERKKLPRLPINQKLIRQIVDTGIKFDELEDRSPYFAEQPDCPDDYLNGSFSENELICVAAGGPKDAQTKPYCEWRGKLNSCDLIVPSPMSSATGTNKQGHETPRCLENTGPRRFLVIEFDSGSANDQAAIIWHLSGFAHLFLVVHSGSKSLHGWFYVEGVDEERVRELHAYAVTLGADPATLTKCQLVRMPAGVRNNGRKQMVYYFDPSF